LIRFVAEKICSIHRGKNLIRFVAKKIDSVRAEKIGSVRAEKFDSVRAEKIGLLKNEIKNDRLTQIKIKRGNHDKEK
jgi:hypothetical protein